MLVSAADRCAGCCSHSNRDQGIKDEDEDEKEKVLVLAADRCAGCCSHGNVGDTNQINRCIHTGRLGSS